MEPANKFPTRNPILDEWLDQRRISLKKELMMKTTEYTHEWREIEKLKLQLTAKDDRIKVLQKELDDTKLKLSVIEKATKVEVITGGP